MMEIFDVKAAVFETFINLAIKKKLNTPKKLNTYFKIKTGGKLLAGEHWHHETHEYTRMTAKLIVDGLPKYITPKG